MRRGNPNNVIGPERECAEDAKGLVMHTHHYISRHVGDRHAQCGMYTLLLARDTFTVSNGTGDIHVHQHIRLGPVHLGALRPHRVPQQHDLRHREGTPLLLQAQNILIRKLVFILVEDLRIAHVPISFRDPRYTHSGKCAPSTIVSMAKSQ